MSKPLSYRIHEWAADNFEWVQYPDVEAVNNNQPFFKHKIPLSQRIGLVVLGLFILGFCAVALFFLAVFFWAIITA